MNAVPDPRLPDPAPHWLRTAWIGALAGALAALLDVASTILWLSSVEDQRRLVLVFALLGVGATALVGALVGALFSRPLLAAGTARALLARSLALVAIPSAAIGHLLFTGGRMRRLPMRVALEPVAALLVAALLALALVSVVRVVRALLAKSLAVRSIGAAVFALCAMALHAADHRVLARLYEYLHVVLGVATAASLAAALALVAPTPSKRAATITMAAAPFALLLALALLSRWDNVRAEVFGTHAPYVRHIAVALEAVAKPQRAVDATALAAIARERAEREARARATEADPTLPRAAGAHVLLVTVDAMRADRLTAERTPSLWALAAQGARFTRAYAQAPHSSYSITTLHTGEFLRETVQLGQRQPLVTLARAFGDAGYRTVGLYTQGIFFTEGERLTAYRDAHLDFSRAEHRDMDARQTTDAAIRELDESLARAEPPTFLWAHYFDAHEPYRGAGATQVQRYDSALATIDREVARLVAHARRALHRPLIVAIAADHGEEFGEHGGVYHGSALIEEQVRVPLVIVAPAVSARVVDAPVGLVDVAPTLLALGAVARPATMRGRDLRPWMAGRDGRFEPVFSAVNTRTMALRWPHKLVADLRWGVRELYDLERDPSERRNLAGDQPATVRALEAEIHGWIASLGGEGAAAARVRMGDRAAVDALVALALDRRASVDRRVDAVDALSSLRDRAVIDRLRPLLESQEPALRLQAAIGAGLVGLDSARAVLLEAVRDERASVRAKAALALAALGDRASASALVELLRAGDEAQRSSALDGISRVATGSGDGLPECEAPLMEALEDDHLRYRAALALGAASRGRALGWLARIAREDRADDARAWAVAGLSLTGEPSVAAVITERMFSDASAQRFAASAYARVQRAGVWDARRASESFVGCARSDDDEPWVTLGARACPVRERVETVRVDRRVALRVWVRARGEGALVVRANDREIMRFSLESAMREWRVQLGASGVGDERWSVEASDGAWLSHIVAIDAGASRR